jgi:hypothetical protein
VWLPPAALVAAGALAAPPPAKRPAPVPRTSNFHRRASGGAAPSTAAAGEFTLRLRRVVFQREAALLLDGRSGGAGRREESAFARLDFDVSGRAPEARDRLAPGEALAAARFRAADDVGRPAGAVTAAQVAEEEAPVLRVTVAGLSPSARGLAWVEGEVPAYPRARRIRFHVPWLKDEVPLRVEVQEGVATLRRFRLVEEDSTLWVSVRPPAGFRLAPLAQVGALSARAVDIYGNLVNGGAITRVEQTAAGEEPEFLFFAPGLRRTPSRLVLDILCVSGTPRPHRFRFGRIDF